jgi:hypothetical protein
MNLEGSLKTSAVTLRRPCTGSAKAQVDLPDTFILSVVPGPERQVGDARRHLLDGLEQHSQA